MAKFKILGIFVAATPIFSSLKLKSDIPIVYFTQLLGLAFGFKPEELGLNKNLISTEKFLKKIEQKVINYAKK